MNDHIYFFQIESIDKVFYLNFDDFWNVNYILKNI